MRWRCALALLPLLLYAQEDVLRPRGAPVFEPWTEARTPIRLGLEGGISWNSASQSINYARVQPTQPTPMDIFKSGSGISPAVAAAVDIGIAPKLGLQFKLGYEQKKWSNSGTGIADCVDSLGNYVYPVTVSVQSHYTVQANYLAIGAALRYDLTPQLWLTVGPVYHRLLGKVRQTERYEADPNSDCRFLAPDENDENLYKPYKVWEPKVERGPDDPVPAPPSGGRFGAELGIGYRIPLSPGLELVPRLSGQLLSSPRNGDVYTNDWWQGFTLGLLPVQWKGLSLYSVLLTVGVWFTIQ
jgi:hypothetical protein